MVIFTNWWKVPLVKEYIINVSNGLDWSNISSILKTKCGMTRFSLYLPCILALLTWKLSNFHFLGQTMKQYKRHIDGDCIVKVHTTSTCLFCRRPSACSQPLKQKGIEAVWPLTNKMWRDMWCCSGPLFILQWLKPASRFLHAIVYQWQWQRAEAVKLMCSISFLVSIEYCSM